MVPRSPRSGFISLIPAQLTLLSVQPATSPQPPSGLKKLHPLLLGPKSHPVSGDLCANWQKAPSPLEDGIRVPSLGSREQARVLPP